MWEQHGNVLFCNLLTNKNKNRVPKVVENLFSSTTMETNVESATHHQFPNDTITSPRSSPQPRTYSNVTKPIPIRPIASRVVVIQSPKATDLSQKSSANSILIPPSSLTTTGKQVLIQAPKSYIPGGPNKYAYLTTLPKRKPEVPVVTHLSVVPAPTNQKIVFKPIKPKVPTIIKSKYNIKISNGQIQSSTAPNEKGITLLLDQLPPLQPLSVSPPPPPTPPPPAVSKEAEKEYQLSIPEGNSNYVAESSVELSINENSTDTVEVTCTISNNKSDEPENKPKETEKRSEERRRKSNPVLKDNDEIVFTSSITPEEPPTLKYHPKKLSIRKELATKSKLALDDIHIEVVKKSIPPVELYSEETEFDPMKVLEWNDGIGALQGSDLKFYVNEWGFLQMVTDGDVERIKAIRSFKGLTCIVCGCQGIKTEFFSNLFCTYACAEKNAKDDLKRKKEKKPPLPVVITKLKTKTEPESTIKTEVSSCNGTPAHSDDEAISNDSKTYPWLTGKKGFSWAKYLSHISGKAAPVKLFKDPFPYTKNGFKVGMKLEGIDPQRPSHYCVLSIAEVLGYRIRLHFDGYPDKHDFWQNADSLNIFPAGWCDKNNHKLHPPKGYTEENFNWTLYLKLCKAQPAPRSLFLNRPENSLCPNGFRLGMKLEAVDRTDSTLICVATVADIMDNRILVHFDSWDDIYDYWADPTSPYIHPVGWCESNGHSLTPPYKLPYKCSKASNGTKSCYKDPDQFTWEKYLKETKSQPAPARAFKVRPAKDFKRGMRIESVDKRIPRFIRVATVDDVRDGQIRVSFDGWLDKYSYWVDDDSPDIHPVGWCQKTGHPIQPPLTPEDIYSAECSTPGCRGWGNTLEPHLEVHNDEISCPYSDDNFDKEHVPDRLISELSKDQKPNEAVPLSKEPKRHAADSTTISSSSHTQPTSKLKRTKSYNSDSDWGDTSSEKKRIKPSKTAQRQTTNILSDPELLRSVTQDNYDPLSTDPDKITPFRWDVHSKNLASYVPMDKDPRTWTEHEVVDFISTIPSCKDLSVVFSKHQIDGEALLMLSQNDLTSILGFKLGPAIKLYNSIVLLRRSVLLYC